MPDRLIAIGDVHGCVHALEALVDAIEPAAGDTLVLLGDVVDYGRDSRDVLNLIAGLRSVCRVVHIEGNHEEMMLWARENDSALAYWENHGGVPTLNSYRFPGKLADVPDEHWRMLEECVPFYETTDFIFTHAHYQPDAPMAEQTDHELRWSLFDPAETRPHFSGKPVTVGHTEQRSGEILDLGYAMCIDTACWRYGWLTAIDRSTGQIWQASKFGVLRAADEPHQAERVGALLAAQT